MEQLERIGPALADLCSASRKNPPDSAQAENPQRATSLLEVI
jgi:hypothetical protein